MMVVLPAPGPPVITKKLSLVITCSGDGLLGSAMGWIGPGRGVQIDMQLLSGIEIRWIAVSIGVVISGTSSGDVFSLRRLGELPDVSETSPAFLWRRRGLCGDTSGCWGTGIVGYEIENLSSVGVLLNVIGGDNPASSTFRSCNSRAVNASTEAIRGNGVYPAIDVGFLFGQHAAALLLIEKDDRVAGESLAFGGCHSALRVRFA